MQMMSWECAHFSMCTHLTVRAYCKHWAGHWTGLWTFTFDIFMFFAIFPCFLAFSMFLGTEVKICDFNQQFLSFSYLFYVAQNDTKNMSFNSWDPDLHDYAKITFIHPVVSAQCPFFDTLDLSGLVPLRYCDVTTKKWLACKNALYKARFAVFFSHSLSQLGAVNISLKIYKSSWQYANTFTKMGKTKQSEVERHRKLRRNRKKELNKYRALWEFLTKKHPKTLEAFEVEYANQPSTSQGPNSNEISEEPLKAPQPTPKANQRLKTPISYLKSRSTHHNQHSRPFQRPHHRLTWAKIYCTMSFWQS